ncbi:hypothetical protein [Nostoc sp. TCL240-02]|uniref:hypothetical protein n=1 Tax=Nostoc sp. TCL240-02 TaxID=2572090 RepID=UPI00157FA692|nr:hypothetical protein [Nostoc sp. TCL240-02]
MNETTTERRQLIRDVVLLNIQLKRCVPMNDICALNDDELERVKGYLITLLP